MLHVDAAKRLNLGVHCSCQSSVIQSSLRQGKHLSNEQLIRKHRAKTTGRSRAVRQRHVSVQAVEPLRYGKGSIQEIPVFPLGVVAFPTADTPLNIFEARYRVLFNTLLAGAEGIAEDLVNPDKPWAGTRLFGLCFITNKMQMASVGTTLHIYKHMCSDDGQMVIVNKGVEKFKVLNVIEERPVMVCQVEILGDDDDTTLATQELAKQALDNFRIFVQLNVKLKQLKSPGDLGMAVEDLTPRELSYWLAQIFAQNVYAQQALLEEASVKSRLIQEKEVLESIVKVLQARLAVQSALSPDASSSSEIPSEGSSPSQGSEPGKSSPAEDQEKDSK